MVRKVLANVSGQDITADFENDEEYQQFCGAVAKECITFLMKSLTLEEAIELWQEKNGRAVRHTVPKNC